MTRTAESVVQLAATLLKKAGIKTDGTPSCVYRGLLRHVLCPRRVNKGTPEFHCVMCTSLIPEKRWRRGSVTCSDEHQRARKNLLRALDHAEKCPKCKRKFPRLTRRRRREDVIPIRRAIGA